LEKVARGEELRAAVEEEGLEREGAGLEEEEGGPPLGTEGEEEAGPGCLEKKPRRVDCFLDVEEEGGAALAMVSRRGRGKGGWWVREGKGSEASRGELKVPSRRSRRSKKRVTLRFSLNLGN